jgi:hypothetical protein
MGKEGTERERRIRAGVKGNEGNADQGKGQRGLGQGGKENGAEKRGKRAGRKGWQTSRKVGK